MRTITTRFQMGDYGTALRIARKHLRDPDFSHGFKIWLKSQFPVLLTSQAWLLIQQGKCEGAVTLLEESLTFRPMLETSKGLGYCFFKLKRWEQAETYLKEYLSKVNKDFDMTLALADVMESLGRHAESSSLIEKAAQDFPQAKEKLKDRLHSMRARIKEAGYQSTINSEHFTVTFRVNEHDGLASQVLDYLETVLFEFQDHWGFQRPDQPIEVLLYSAKDFSNLVAYGPKWAGGLYDGRLRIQVKETTTRPFDSVKKVIRHELVHALLAEKTDQRRMPYWFNEGLAMLLECERGCPPERGGGVSGDFLPIDKFTQNFTHLPKDQAGLVYRQSLFLIHSIRNQMQGEFDRPLLEIIRHLNRQSPLESDDLLRPLRISFHTAHDRAKKRWPGNP